MKHIADIAVEWKPGTANKEMREVELFVGEYKVDLCYIDAVQLATCLLEAANRGREGVIKDVFYENIRELHTELENNLIELTEKDMVPTYPPPERFSDLPVVSLPSFDEPLLSQEEVTEVVERTRLYGKR
jgi:hypothetical protein